MWLIRNATPDQLVVSYAEAAFTRKRSSRALASAASVIDPASETLTWGQSALLAVVAQSPLTHGLEKHPTAALEPRAYVLNRLVELGAISAQQRALADLEPLPQPSAPRPHQ